MPETFEALFIETLGSVNKKNGRRRKFEGGKFRVGFLFVKWVSSRVKLQIRVYLVRFF